MIGSETATSFEPSDSSAAATATAPQPIGMRRVATSG